MTDVKRPETAAYLRAAGAAVEARRQTTGRVTAAEYAAYRDAVAELERALALLTAIDAKVSSIAAALPADDELSSLRHGGPARRSDAAESEEAAAAAEQASEEADLKASLSKLQALGTRIMTRGTSEEAYRDDEYAEDGDGQLTGYLRQLETLRARASSAFMADRAEPADEAPSELSALMQRLYALDSRLEKVTRTTAPALTMGEELEDTLRQLEVLGARASSALAAVRAEPPEAPSEPGESMRQTLPLAMARGAWWGAPAWWAGRGSLWNCRLGCGLCPRTTRTCMCVRDFARVVYIYVLIAAKRSS
jgi:transcription elongation GreA/GreB family factor